MKERSAGYKPELPVPLLVESEAQGHDVFHCALELVRWADWGQAAGSIDVPSQEATL